MYLFQSRHVVLLVLISVLVHCRAETKTKKSTLKQVHVLFRHGDRAPVGPYPKDPNNSESLWPNGFGQLTKAGLQMQNRLGRWFRAQYGSLLHSHWNASQVAVTATYVDRTMNSAQANLQGLYAPLTDQWRFREDLDWSPVPVRTAPPGADKLMNVDEACPRIKDEVEKVNRLPEVEAVTLKSKPLMELLSEELGAEIDSIEDIDHAYDNFKIQMIYNITPPAWVVPHLPAMANLSEFSFELIAYSDALKLLRGGPLILKIIEDMERKTSSNESSPNLFMYSGHDTTVAANLETLGLYDRISPPYAATVIYELHERNGKHFVNLLYRNDTILPGGEAVRLTLPGCAKDCPLHQFRSLLKRYLPTDYEDQCRRAATDCDAGQKDRAILISETVLVSLSACTLVLVIALLALTLSWRSRFKRLHEYSLLAQDS